MIQDSNRARRARYAVSLFCACASGWIYWVVARLALKMPPAAEPTYAGEVFPWVRVITARMIPSIQAIHLQEHGFRYLLWFTACCAGLFALYAIMLRLARGVQPRWFMVVAAGVPALYMGMLLCAPVMLSSDVYSYAHYGRMLAVFGADVNVATGEAFNVADPFSLGGGYFDFVPNVYGPVWTLASAAVVQAGNGHIGLTVLLFRGIEALAALGCGALIWLILKGLAPERAAQGVVLFLWNPLVIIESALSGHNDTCMMALALLALWLHVRGFKAGAVVALALSALVKVITWPLVPLYILMILRSPGSDGPHWKERIGFLSRATIGVAAAVALSMWCARMSVDSPTEHLFGSPQFYLNNYHEPLFRGLRRMLGEPEATIQAPMDFKVSWVAPGSRVGLHSDISDTSRDLCLLRPEQPLLVLSTPLSREPEDWVRLFDPGDRAVGFLRKPQIHEIAAPPNVEKDPAVCMLAVSPQDWPTVVVANRWIRIVTWGLFAAFGLLVAWKTTDLENFVVWGAAFFLAADLLVLSKIWPWYMLWPLAFGALKPQSSPARLAMILSGGMILLYVFLDFADTRFEWAYDYRSIFTIILPVVVFVLLWAVVYLKRFRVQKNGLSV